MRKLSVFNQVSLDGYFVDAHDDMSWAHRDDPQWTRFTQQNAGGEAELIFGRVTYEQMASFWPTAAARAMNAPVAARMNAMKKVVFSKTLDKASWANTKLIKSDLLSAVRRLKRAKGPDLLIMGSGSLVAQLTEAGLIDSYQVVVNPLVLGGGRTMFEGVSRRALTLTKSKAFKNGNVVLWYERR